MKCTICGEIRDSRGYDNQYAKPLGSWHKWVAISGCKKRCEICGAIAHNHDYDEIRFDSSNDFTYYKCSKCGHEGECTFADTRQVDYIK